jgi:hypothetical protein
MSFVQVVMGVLAAFFVVIPPGWQVYYAFLRSGIVSFYLYHCSGAWPSMVPPRESQNRIEQALLT